MSETPWLDAIVLLEYASGRPREDLLAELPQDVKAILRETALHTFEQAFHARATGTPVAYITGVREFRGLPIHVGPDVLIPRPETETLVETALRCIAEIGQTVHYHDCCTGSGCVAIAVVLESIDRGITIHPGLSDIKEKAVACAQRNVKRLVPPEIVWDGWCAPGLDKLTRSVDLITANPPYLTIKETEAALSRGWGEPFDALSGGADGFSTYRTLIPAAVEKLEPGGFLVLECGETQAPVLEETCRAAGFTDTLVIQDYGGKDRVVSARK